MSLPTLILSILLITILLLACGLWVVVPLLSGLPWRPTSAVRIRRALSLAQVQPGERVYDLGSGDGRILFAAARDFGARATGIEISPLHCLLTWLNARLSYPGKPIHVRWGNFYTADLSDADVVLAYMTSKQAGRLKPALERQLQPGARVVTMAFELEGWQPQDFDQEALLYLYRMPPEPGSLGSFLARQANS